MANYVPPKSTIASDVISSITAAPGNVISGVGRTATALSDFDTDTKRYIGGEITGKQFGESAYKNLSKAGAEGVGTAFLAAAPVFSSSISGLFTSAGADKLTDDGKTYIANEIADGIGISTTDRDSFIDGTKSLLDIASTYAGIKGSQRMSKPRVEKRVV
jgi:hypothetical protein